jgi:AsmA family protein
MKLKTLLLGLSVPLALLAGGFALGEWRGWPWLAAPLSQLLSERLGRELQVLPAAKGGEQQALRLSLLGGVTLQAGRLLIGGPAWRAATPTLDADRVELQLRYRDLWEWRSSGTLRVRSLKAAAIKADLWRDGQGRATWTLQAPASSRASSAGPALLRFERLLLGGGQIALHDDVHQLIADIDFALGEREGQVGSLFAMAQGRYRGRPLQAWLDSAAPLPLMGLADAGHAAPLRLQLRTAAVALDFDGQLRELGELQGLDGVFRLSGPSLAAIGDPLGVTLPSTAPFNTSGRLSRDGPDWRVEIGHALLGRSRLDGNFVFAPGGGRRRPTLSGRLGGETLWFADLGPTIGVPLQTRPAGAKLLPERQFDLPALRAMDADVTVALQRVELGSAFAEAIAPLRGRLVLQDGVLSLRELDARTAQGRLGGAMSLDGRAAAALWRAELNWSGVALERWLRQGRAKGQPPYVSGLLQGRLNLSGQGRSTAELLASAQGRVLAFLPRGKISHLAVEAAGIDLAQGLGILLRGDESLALHCAVADLRVAKGQVVPDALLLDTADSTLWVEGSLSLASEQLDLRLQVAPKDFSPLSLRTPVQIRGSLAAPAVSLQTAPLMRRLVPAVLLAMLNPLAGLLPLIDSGATEADRKMLQSCQRLLARRQR